MKIIPRLFLLLLLSGAPMHNVIALDLLNFNEIEVVYKFLCIIIL